jgi:hypothetical protein
MKICKKCLKNKEKSEFYSQVQKGINGQSWPYLDCYCKECRISYAKNRSINIKLKAIEYLGGSCKDCGLIDIPSVYDFHHIDPTKKELAFGTRGGRSFETLKSELDKCELLCANCHRKRHSI